MNIRHKASTAIKIIKRNIIGHATYGHTWRLRNNDFYLQIHDDCADLHNDFQNYTKSKDFKTVLEVGCGTSIYTSRYNLFDNKEYVGIDISESAIKECKQQSNRQFICDDFQKINLKKKFDLVFSHAVIDHVYNIDDFVRRIIDTTDKYAYISTYRGYHDKLEHHKMQWASHDGCYFNDISIPKIRKVLLAMGLNENQIIDRPYSNHGVIEIDKTIS